MLSEAGAVKLSSFLIGLGQKCIVAAIKKYREAAELAAQEETAKTIDEVEAAKSVATKIEQRITASIRQARLSADQVQRLLALETQPLLKDELVAGFTKGDISAARIAELFVKGDSALEIAHDGLVSLASVWLDAIDNAIAGDPVVSRILNLRAQRRLQSELSSMGAQMARSEVRAEEQHSHVSSELAVIRSLLTRTFDKESASVVPDYLKSVNQRRFDRARDHLLHGSVAVSEHEYRALVEDLESLGPDADLELLQRSYMNLAASLWEQNRHPEVAPWLDKARTIEPDGWRAKRSAALALMARGDMEGAIPFLRAVRELKPNEVDHICNEAWALKNVDRTNEALTLLTAREFQDSSYFATLSLTYLRAEQFAEAESAARKAIAVDPDCEMAQTALAYALGLPIINRRQRRETIRLDPTKEERDHLLEAIQVGERAANTLRQAQRLYSLGELVANLSPMCAAVVQLDKAVQFGEEALRINPNDEVSLVNLWCARMRKGEYHAAAEAASRRESILGTVQAWENKAEALLAGDKAQAVIDDWKQKETQPQFSTSIDAHIVVARAFSDRNRTEDGVAILDKLLAQYPSDCRLLAARGLLRERLGKHTEAERDLFSAEQSAPPTELAQVLAHTAMFYYRRAEWRKASERLERIGAASLYNPLFTKFLTCIFNEGDYRQALRLAEDAIAAQSCFNEDHYAIAARSHQLGGNLPRAKQLLEELVARNTAHDQEHRKLLGWIYWRLDELPQAYDVLLRGLQRHPKGIDMLILLSAVCTVLGRYNDALEYAHQAVVIDPEHVASRLAMVRAALSCPKDFQVDQRYLDTHFQSLTFLHQHESRVIQTIPVEEDLHSILEMVKRRASEVRRFEDQFQSRKLPMSFFGRTVGASPFQLWAALLGHERLRVRFAFGTEDEQRSEQEAVQRSEGVSLDLFALFTLGHLNLLHLLPRMFRRVFVHGSILESIIDELRELQQHPEQSSLSYVEGKFYHAERKPEQTHSIRKFLEPIRDFLKSQDVTIVGSLAETAKNKTTSLILETCGQEAIAPLLVAKEQAITLFCDDVVIRTVARLDGNVPGFCSQALLRVANTRGLLTSTEYQDAILKLIESNYAFVSEDAGILRRLYDKNGGRMTPLAKAMINRVNDVKYNAASCLPLLAEFCVHVWLNASPAGADNRETWVREIWQAVSKAKDGQELALEFQGKLAVVSRMHPAAFAGIVTFAIRRISAFRTQRDLMFQVMQGVIASVARVAAEAYSFLPQLSDEWRQQSQLNQILRRNGWLS